EKAHGRAPRNGAVLPIDECLQVTAGAISRVALARARSARLRRLFPARQRRLDFHPHLPAGPGEPRRRHLSRGAELRCARRPERGAGRAARARHEGTARSGRPPDGLRALARALDALPGGRFDLVHIHTPFIAHYAGVRLARRADIPAIATYHTFFEEYLHHYLPLVPAPLARFLARSFTRSQCAAVHGLIAPSEPMRAV